MNNIIRSTRDKANATREKIKMKMEEVSLAYFTPAEINGNNELTYREKILYSQLLALAQQKGYVYATDEYLCALNGVFSKSSIQKWLKGLRDKGYIFSQLIYNDVTNNIESRKIFLTDKFKSAVSVAKDHVKKTLRKRDALKLEKSKNEVEIKEKKTEINENHLNVDKKEFIELIKNFNSDIDTKSTNIVLNKLKASGDDTLEYLIDSISRAKTKNNNIGTLISAISNKDYWRNTGTNNNSTPKTRYHNIETTYDNYDDDELERILLEGQKAKFGQ